MSFVAWYQMASAGTRATLIGVVCATFVSIACVTWLIYDRLAESRRRRNEELHEAQELAEQQRSLEIKERQRIDREKAEEQERRNRALQIADVDSMEGHAFEVYVSRLLKHQGYAVYVTVGSGDLGVDVVATKDDVRYAVQTKRQSSNVPRTAVSDAVAGMRHYKCNQAMVVTNSYFTNGAIKLATSCDCKLLDRDQLINWIIAYQDSQDKNAHSRLTAP
jgi:HJR/Mrr/RecB family endonuclease